MGDHYSWCIIAFFLKKKTFTYTMAAAQNEFIKALTTALTTAIQTVTSQQKSDQGGNISGRTAT